MAEIKIPEGETAAADKQLLAGAFKAVEMPTSCAARS